ncbi:MAG: YbhB/YbcL family Raf kinase inhibitor-like protein [Sneathiella sp.]|nr:MAG: YbhB/YbcL family Raf kinase inhibitor-like protein [Sneathiella sp.]
MKLSIEGWLDGDKIPGKFAFGVPADEGHVALSDNKSPAMKWSGAPAGAKSFALICHDSDVPSSGEDVNQEGKTVPENLPRVDFYHLVLTDIPAEYSSFAEGELGEGVTPKGKAPGQQAYGVTGVNNFTDWFAGDPDMGGDYGGYDGPCPPWNDSIIHHYHFTIYALDVESLDLSGSFGGPDALDAMQGHVLASGSFVGKYSLNPDVYI